MGLINVLLIKQNLDLRRQLAAGGRTLELTTNVLKPGDVVAAVTATDLNGRPYRLEYSQDRRHHLLLFFSPNCPYCEQQSPLWRDLLDTVDKNRFTVLGVVSITEDRRLVSAHAEGAGYFKTKTPLPIVFFDNESLGRYKLTATPTTLLIDENGKVEHAWVGRWDESRAMEVAAVLKQEN
jgi:peroxiredoxin